MRCIKFLEVSLELGRIFLHRKYEYSVGRMASYTNLSVALSSQCRLMRHVTLKSVLADATLNGRYFVEYVLLLHIHVIAERMG